MLVNQHIHHKSEAFLKKVFVSIWHDGLWYKIVQSCIGGKMYDTFIKSTYSDNTCAVQISNRITEFFSHWVRQGCSLSSTLFNLYINELAVILEQSVTPSLTLKYSEVKFFYADDLVVLSATAEGLQQHLDLLENYCQNWTLTVNSKKKKKKKKPWKTLQQNTP